MSRWKRRCCALLLAVLLAVMGFAGWRVAAILWVYREGEQTYKEIAKLSLSGQAWQTQGESGQSPHVGRDFEALRQVNPDVVAWLSISGTEIDYPVVQGRDNSYYLTHLVTGKENTAGSIFLDVRSASDFSHPYSIIYGHHLQNGTMFTPLMGYKEQTFYDAHPEGRLETPERSYAVAFFAGFVADRENEVWDIDLTAEELLGWTERMIRRSWFQSSVRPSETDRVIALSTCSYEYDNARFVLLGILREET